MTPNNGIPVLCGSENVLSLGMDKKELQSFLVGTDILKNHRVLPNGYDWYDLWVCPTGENFLASLCFNPSEKLETITLYPFIKPIDTPKTWDSMTEEYLMANRKICEDWLQSNSTMSILKRATTFIDKRGWNTGILIR